MQKLSGLHAAPSMGKKKVVGLIETLNLDMWKCKATKRGRLFEDFPPLLIYKSCQQFTLRKEGEREGKSQQVELYK